MFLRYIGKRVLQTLIVLFFVSIFAFLLIRMASGNPARMMLPDVNGRTGPADGDQARLG